MPFSLLLFDPFLDFFYLGYLAGDLDHSIDHQGRSDHHAIVADGFDVLYFYDFRLDAQFLNCFLRSLRELIAFRSAHSQDLNFLHVLLLSVIRIYMGFGPQA
jgi:hypothetical protein